MKKMNADHKQRTRNFHAAKWDEPIIFELHKSGERGVVIPGVEEEISQEVKDSIRIPKHMRRKKKPQLPEISQARVLRHYLRLSQQTLGADLNIDIGQGTCTMKYAPKINEHLIRTSKIQALHPLQEVNTVQGILEIMYRFDEIMRSISGMDFFSFQPGGGSQALFAMASIVQAKHKTNGEDEQRDEIITTKFSHPSSSASATLKGYKIITLQADEDGLPMLDDLKKVVSNRTAGFITSNPEDTGIYNHRIREFTDIVHEAGGICYYDQANANASLGITRAKEAGFDMCFFNLHKTFGAPHNSGGPATGALGVTAELKDYLPTPIVEYNGENYHFNYELKHSIGKVRLFHGVPQTVIRAYAWVLSLGEEAFKQVSRIAVLNNNYLYHKVLQIKGVDAPYIKGSRLEQVRYNWGELTEETGVTTEDIQRRMTDFGHHYWTSHHPFTVPQPVTLEPTESYSKEDLDEYVASLTQISKEAYEEPEKVKQSPHRSVIHKIEDQRYFTDLNKWASTWRAYKKKQQIN